MAQQTSVFNIVEGAQKPDMLFSISGVEATDFASIQLEVRRNDGKLLDKTAVVDDPGSPGSDLPLIFHFEWDPGDITYGDNGKHLADLVLVIGTKPLKLPEIKPILLVVRRKA